MIDILRNILILCALLFYTGFTSAQSLALDSCLRLAEQNNCNLAQALLSQEKAQQVRNQARTKYFPQVNLIGAGFHALNPMAQVGIEDIPNATARDLLNTLYTNYGAALGLDKTIGFMQHGLVATVSAVQPIYMGGKIVAGNKLAQLGIQAARLQTDIQHRDVLLSVEESYWLVVNLEAKRQTVRSVASLLDTLHTIVSGAVNAGITLQNDLLMVEMRQDELSAQTLQLNNGIVLACRALFQAVGLPYSDKVQLCDTVSDYLPDTLAAPTTVNRPESQLLSLQVRAEQLKRRMTLADALPQVALGGVYGYMNYLAPLSQSARSQYITTSQEKHLNGFLGVMVRVPITDWWETGHKLKEHDLMIRQAQLQQKDLDEKMLLQEQQAYDRMRETYALIKQYERSLQHAEENLRLAQINYKAGMLTISDLLQSQALYLQAKNNLTDARIQYRIAYRTYFALME
ncbi:MAG: TolC family protein [Paludibacteraceae bacterium]|nr:TolC family protein [Paludibacteraceae bacterium]